MSDDIKRVQDFLNRMVKDNDFAKRVKEDKTTLADLGWSPEVVSGFQVKYSDNPSDPDYWGCGTECGCTAGALGQGGSCVCKAGHGSGGG